jgi:hypothetical protein
VNKFNLFESRRSAHPAGASQAGRLNLPKLLKSAYPKLTTKFTQFYFNKKQAEAIFAKQRNSEAVKSRLQERYLYTYL